MSPPSVLDNSIEAALLTQLGIHPTILMELEQAAREVSERAYSPYSNFPVGAAVLAGSGKIYSGCNVENASFGMTSCAEKNAIFTAVAAGEREIKAVVVFTLTDEVTLPCGACRQVINEFGTNCLIVSVCNSSKRVVTTTRELLPSAFGPENLGKSKKGATYA